MSSTPSVAFCFSGQLRDLDQTIAQWRDLQEKYEAQVFGSFWAPSTRSEEAQAELFQSLSPVIVEFEPFSKFKPFIDSFYAEMSVPTTERVNFGLAPGASDWICSGSILSMWYRVWRAHMIAQNSNSDLWVRFRTDTRLENLNLASNSSLNLPWGWRMNLSWSDCGGPIDMLALGRIRGDDLLQFYLLVSRTSSVARTLFLSGRTRAQGSSCRQGCAFEILAR